MPSLGAPSRSARLRFRSDRERGERAADHQGLALLEQIERLRHLRVDGEQVGLERAQLLERGVRLVLRSLDRLARLEMRGHEQIGQPFRVLQRRDDDPALELRIPRSAQDAGAALFALVL